MRVLIHGINYHPELTGIGKYTGEMAQWLSEKGASVRVVTAPPYYPDWKVGDGYSCSNYKLENIRGIDVWRCPLWIPKNKTGFKRILHLLSFAVSSLPILFKQIFWKPNVLIVIEPTFLCVPLSLIVAKLSGAKSWLHIQDFEIDASFKMGFLSGKSFYRMVKHIERFIMKRFDSISTISSKMFERLVNNGIPSENCVLFPNWADIDKIYPISECDFFRKEWEVREDTVVVLYSGNMGEKQGLEIIIETARKLSSDRNILFVLCGNGTAREKLLEMAAEMKNIRFLPTQPLERLNQLLNTANIHLLPQRDDAEDLVMPSKLTGILACGGIAITNARKDTELANVVLQAGGMVCIPGDSSGIIKMIKEIASNPILQTEMRLKSRNYAESNLSKNTILNKFYNELGNIIPKRNIQNKSVSVK
jgi:putative colanic acid biosynthesis glycosyltransferase WcaI